MPDAPPDDLEGPPPAPSLAERVERLERSVAALHERFDALEEHRGSTPAGSSHDEGGAQPRHAGGQEASRAPLTLRQRAQRGLRGFDWEGEQWLSRIGIGLLLFGVAFFFKLSVEQGWLRPVVRIACGVAFGAGLGGVGARVGRRQPLLGQILMGGASAVLYATVFAAYQLYALIGNTGALAGAAAVALLTAWRSLKQDDAALAVVGALGALGAPFLLYSGGGSVAGLVGYTCLVLAGGAAVYFFEGWRALLYTVALGGWATFGFVYFQLPGSLTSVSPPGMEAGRVALQAGIVFAWLLFWSVPTLREVLQERQMVRASRPGRWGPLRREQPSSLVGAFLFRPPAHTLAFSSPLVALAFSRQLWTWTPDVWGAAALGGAAIYALAYLGLRETEDALAGLAQAHGLVAAVLLAYGLSELTGGETFLLAFTAEAGALLVLSRTLSDRALRLTAHAFFAGAALVLAWRLLFWPAPAEAVALSRLGSILIGAGAARVLAGPGRRMYQAAALALLLGWLWRQCSPLPGGEALATVSWGAVAVALLVVGLRRRFWRNAALAVIVALVAKLFLVDLARLAAGWRVLLFTGFGGLFLLLSYFLPGGGLASAGEREKAGGRPGCS